jgi:hypothetical protein
MCDDNDICRCQFGSTWQTYVMMQIKIVMFKVLWWKKNLTSHVKLMSCHLKFHHNLTLRKSSVQWVQKLLYHVWNLCDDVNQNNVKVSYIMCETYVMTWIKTMLRSSHWEEKNLMSHEKLMFWYKSKQLHLIKNLIL